MIEEKEFELNEFEADSIEDTTYKEYMDTLYLESQIESYLRGEI